MPRKVEVSHKTIVFTVVFLLSLWLLFYIRDIIMQFFVALLIMAILNPLVTMLSRFRVPRALSIILTYLLVFGLFGASLAGVVPNLIDQTTGFADNLPTYLSSLGVGNLISEQLSNQLLSQIGSIPAQVVRLSVSIVSNVLTVLFVLIFAFYLLLARDRLDDQLSYFFGDEKKLEVRRVIDSLEVRLGGWARGELGLMVLVGATNYIGLSLLGIPFAVSLAILAGLLEIVPYIGPIVAGTLATIIGLSISPVTGLAVAAMAFLIQQIENYVFVPKIMEKSVGVNPIVSILALTIGFRLFGFVGVLIAIPMVITLQVLSEEYLFKG